jgi:hypothetical protein
MMRALPEGMFIEQEQTRFSVLRNWILSNEVTEITMKERQFWNFVHLQPSAEKPWTSYMGRAITVVDMPDEVRLRLGFPGERRGEI